MAESTHLAARCRPEQARSRAKYDALLDAAAELLAENGLGPTTVTAIAERAGVALTALYWYFPNKAAILHQLAVRTNNDDNRALIDPIAESDLTPEEIIAAIIDGYWQRHRDQPWRLALRTALQSDSELAAVYLDDVRSTTPVLAAHLASRTGQSDIKVLERRVMLVTELIDAVVASASGLGSVEAEAVISDFAIMATHLLTAPDQ